MPNKPSYSFYIENSNPISEMGLSASDVKMSLLGLKGIRKSTKFFHKIKQWPKNVTIRETLCTTLYNSGFIISILPTFTCLIRAERCSRHCCPSFLELTHLNLKRQMLLLIQSFLSVSKGVGVRTPTIPKFGNVQIPYLKRCTICI